MATMTIERDLTTIHRVMTNALSSGMRFIDESEATIESKKGLLTFLDCLVTLIHEHHNNEEENFFPQGSKLMPKCPFSKFTLQHQEILTLLHDLEKQLDTLRNSNGAKPDYTDIRTALDRLGNTLKPHFEGEECCAKDSVSIIDPKIQQQLCEDMAEHGKANSKPAKLMLPFLLYNSSPEDRELFEEILPWFVRKVLIGMLWKSRWSVMKPYFAYPPE